MATQRVSRVAGLTFAALGGVLLAYAAILAVHSQFSQWGWVRAAGTVVRVVTSDKSERSAPVVSYRDEAGNTHTVLVAQAPRASHYTPGDRVEVRYHRQEPSVAHLSGFSQTYAFPLLLATAGALLLLIAASITEPPEVLRAASRRGPAPVDPQLLQLHPFNAVAARHYMSELGAPDERRKVKITDAAQALVQGRVPVVLAEFAAYASAMAYNEDAAAFIARRWPRAKQPQQLSAGGINAIGFVFERHAVIAIAETDASHPWVSTKQAFQKRAGPRELVPDDVVWDATARNRAAAGAWEHVRAAAEAWLKTAAPDYLLREEDGEPVPFIFTGHGLGGTVAMLAAYEFAKRGRPIAAVITFGAAPAGGRAFLDDYADLGLDERTLSVTCMQPALPVWRWPLSRPAPGITWPLDIAGVLPASQPPAGATFLARRAHRRLLREEAHGMGHQRNLFSGSAARLLALSRTARIAMLRHDIERRYALRLSLMVLDRLRELMEGDERAAMRALSDHLLDIRGARPAQANEVFSTLDDLPSAAAKPADAADAVGSGAPVTATAAETPPKKSTPA